MIKRLAGSAGVWTTFESGSFTHGTGIPGHSDVDLMGRIMPGERPTLPSSSLSRLKAAINAESWRFSKVSVSSPAVKVKFATGPDFEIAPAYLADKENEVEIFWIPGPNEEWVRSAPQSQNAYVNSENERLEKRLKPLIRLLKKWKYSQAVPVSSAYLELQATRICSSESIIIYDLDLIRILSRLVSVGFQPMNDPVALVSRVKSTSSEANRKQAVDQADKALHHLRAAYDARKGKDASDYWSNMYKIYGTGFPWPNW